MIDDALLAVTVPALPPKATTLGDTRLVPSMVTTVPPEVGPSDGLTEVIVGARHRVRERRILCAGAACGCHAHVHRARARRRSDAETGRTEHVD